MVTADPDSGQVTYNPEYLVMKHASHFIENGAVRLALAGPWAGSAFAFENPSGDRVILVNNPSAAAAPITIRLGRRTARCRLHPRSINTIILEGAST